MAKKPMFQIMNNTDGFPFCPRRFYSERTAQKAIDKWRAQMEKLQGYYLTSRRERIPVSEVELEIIQIA